MGLCQVRGAAEEQTKAYCLVRRRVPETATKKLAKPECPGLLLQGLFDNCLENGWVIRRQRSQDLAVQLDILILQGADELRVRNAIRTDGRVQPNLPEHTE